MSRKPRSSAQPDEHEDEQHNIYKVPAQDVIRNRERKEPIRRSRPHRSLNGDNSLSEAIRRAQ